MRKYYDCGIDLGTTNSCIAIFDGEKCTILNNTEVNMPVTPSAVIRKESGVTVVGKKAYDNDNPDTAAREFKRWMGTTKSFHFNKANEDWSDEDLSAAVLQEVVKHAKHSCERNFDDAVITVPASFEIPQKEATKRAAQKAGFRNVTLLQEPIAAAIAYGLRPDTEDQYWMVFDFGGGTLDTAIVSTHHKRIRIVDSQGDNYLGGSDIDNAFLQKVILPRICEKYDIDDKNKRFMRRVKLLAEDAKIKLSTSDVVRFELDPDEYRALTDAEGEPIEYSFEITKGEFENAISDVVEKTIIHAKNALKSSNIGINRLNAIVLVGGSTYIPYVRKRIEESFNVPISYDHNPMTVVAEGAAIYASTLVVGEENPDEVCTFSLSYNGFTSDKSVKVSGAIPDGNIYDISKVKIEGFSDAEHLNKIFNSDWINLFNVERGAFSVEIILNSVGSNYFQILAKDHMGNSVNVEGGSFEIVYNKNAKKIADAILFRSIGIRVLDERGNNTIDPLFFRDDSYPSNKQSEYILTRDLNPGNKDILRIEVYEGENFDYPPANTLIGTLKIDSVEFGQKIAKGTRVNIKVEINENGSLDFVANIPSINQESKHFIIVRNNIKENLDKRLDEIDKSMKPLEKSVHMISNEFGNQEYVEKFMDVHNAFIDIQKNDVDNVAEIRRFIREFYEFLTEVIRFERSHSSKVSVIDEDYSEKIENAIKYIERSGSEEDKVLLKNLLNKYSNATNPEDKVFAGETIDNLGFRYKIRDMDFLRETLELLKKPFVNYSDIAGKLAYMKKADDASKNNNQMELLDAVVNLLDIVETNKTSNATINGELADLQKLFGRER